MIAGMELADAALVVGAGLVAGIVNAMAEGSLLTVALNVFGAAWTGGKRHKSCRSSRPTSSVRATAKKASEVSTVPVMVPVIAGSLLGSLQVSSVTDEI